MCAESTKVLDKSGAFQVALVSPKRLGYIPGLGRSPGEGHGNPLQYSCLENPVVRETSGLSPWGHKESMPLSTLSKSRPHIIISKSFSGFSDLISPFSVVYKLCQGLWSPCY